MATHDKYLVRTITNHRYHNLPQLITIRGTTFLIGPFLGPAIAGYISASTNWISSFGVLTSLYGLSTILVLLFGRETYLNPSGKKSKSSHLASYFGIGNTNLPKCQTLWYWCRTLVIYVFRFPLFMVGIAILVIFTWPIGMFIFTWKGTWPSTNPNSRL